MFLSYVMLLSLAPAAPAPPVIHRFGNDLTASAVLVDNAALAHTRQFVAKTRDGISLEQEIKDVLDQLTSALADVQSTPRDVVKVNVYAADAKVAQAALDHLSQWCPKRARPAVCAVITALPHNRRFALDAVFAAQHVEKQNAVSHHVPADPHQATSAGESRVSVLPKGDVVYVSGQAEPGDLAAATQATLAGLLKTLHALELSQQDIVHVKCFLTPMTDVAVVAQQLRSFFGTAPVPAVSYVEWITGGSRPIEIELIAAAPATQTTATVTYLTPPGMKASPVFSRVARIHGNRRIYVAGLTSLENGDGVAQVHSVFQQLIHQLKPARSNLRHLAKATYYVSDADASAELNQLRPHYYDPQRPPAASKALVHGTGKPGRTLAIDMIAAPEAPLNRVLVPIAEKLQPTRKVVYKTVADRDLHLHIFEPAGHKTTDRRPVFLAIHGGGWTGGNAQVFYPFAAHFAQQGMLAVSLEYRLYPKQKTTVFDCVRDARSSVRWLRKHAETLGIDPAKIVAMGGSAGGHLAISTALFDDVNESTDDLRISARPDGIILVNPVIDTSAEGYGQAKIGEAWKDLSPVHHVRSGLPPTLIFHGTADNVTPYTGAAKFHTLSLAAGNTSKLITHPGGRHGYIIFDLQDYRNALEQMHTFLKQHEFVLPKP